MTVRPDNARALSEFRLSPGTWKGIWILTALFTFLLFFHRAWFIPGTDAEAYFRAGIRALQGDELYRDEATPFKYLPPISYLFIPLGLLPFQAAKVLIFAVNWLIGVGLYATVARRYGSPIALTLLVTFFRFHNYEFLNGQINHWILLLFCLFLELRNRKPWCSAACFAVAACFKVTPLILLLPLIAFRRVGEVVKILVCLSAFLLLPLFTFRQGQGIYASWYHLLKTTTPWPAPSIPIIQSVQAALWYWTQGFFEPSIFSLVVNALFVAMVFITVWRSGGPTAVRQSQTLCALAVLCVVFSPLAWKHHYLLIWPAFLILLTERCWRTALAAFFLLSLGPALVSIFSKNLADRSYMTVIGALLVWGMLVRVVELRSKPC